MDIFSTTITMSLLLGGATVHLDDKFAPAGGYNALNYDVGFEFETSSEGFGVGIGGAGHLDSFGVLGFTGGSRFFYRIKKNEWEISPSLSILYTHLSYYEGLVPAIGLEVCKGYNCGSVNGVLSSVKSDGILHFNYKRRF